MKIILIGKGTILYQIAAMIKKIKHFKLKLILWDGKSNNLSDQYYYKNSKKLNKTIKIRNINSKKSIDILNKIDFDYLLSINNTQIFKKVFLQIFKNQIINYHYSLIPSYKGLYSCTKVLLKKEKYTGISWHFVTKKIDQGDLVYQKRIKINNKDNASSLIIKLNNLCLKTFNEFISNLKKNKIILSKNKKIKDFKLKIKDEKYSKINCNMDSKTILSIFKAFDYSPFDSPLPKVKIKFDKEYEIKNIEIIKTKKIDGKFIKIDFKNYIFKSKDNKHFKVTCA
mgnify:CR=1 FL=1